MTTGLTTYGTTVVSSTLSTAGTLASTTGGTATTSATKVGGTPSGWGELRALGTTAAWPGLGAIGAPSGYGWLLNTTLDGKTLLAGIYTPTITLWTSTSGSSVTADITLRVYKYALDGTFTLIGSMSITGRSITHTATAFSPTAASFSSMSFAPGETVYVDVWLHITAYSGLLTSSSILVSQSSTATGIANDVQLVTPGYQGVRTIPCDAALSAQRTIPCTASLSLPTGVRVILCDSALSLTQTRTIVCNSALQATLTRTVPATAAFSTPDKTRTILASAALLLTPPPRIIPCSCSLGGGIIRTIPASVALIATQSRTIGCTASLAWSPFTRFPTVARRTGMLPFAARRTGLFPQRKRRES